MAETFLRFCHFLYMLRSSIGVMPTEFLNALLKEVKLVKPHSSDTFIIFSSVFFKSSTAFAASSFLSKKIPFRMLTNFVYEVKL